MALALLKFGHLLLEVVSDTNIIALYYKIFMDGSLFFLILIPTGTSSITCHLRLDGSYHWYFCYQSWTSVVLSWRREEIRLSSSCHWFGHHVWLLQRCWDMFSSLRCRPMCKFFWMFDCTFLFGGF